MGEVWQALDTHTQEAVAVKLLHPSSSMHTVRFEREAHILLSLRHPNIVRYLGHGATQRPYYLVMEWLEGEALSARLQRGALSLESSIFLLQELSRALAFTHQQQIIHRDLKPQNIILCPGDPFVVKLIDFGLARPTMAADSLTQTGTVLGTLGYTAPEQARGNLNIDERADLFSLGCVLFQCLTGKAPFSGENAVAIFAKILLERSPSVQSLRPQTPVWLEGLVDQLLSKSPDDRPANALAILQQIETQEAVQQKRPVTQALGDKERHLFFVLLISTQQDPSAEETQIAVPKPLQSLLQGELERLDGRLEPLADGSLIVLFSGDKLATDQARKVAQLALSWRPLLRGPMALTLGRGESSDQLGEALERAGQLLQVETSKESSILVGSSFAELLGEHFVVTPRADYFLLQDTTQEHRPRTLLGKATPFVGRERELASLLGFFEQSQQEEQAQVILVTGSAGSGKSRLGREFVQGLKQRQEPFLWLQANGDPIRAGSPFGLLAQALRGLCEIAEGDPLELRQQKCQQRLSQRLAPAHHARVIEFLGVMMGIPPINGGSPALRTAKRDAQIMHEQMRRAFEDWLEAENNAQPILLLLEDLHWGDAATMRFIDGALKRLKDKAFLVVAFARPEVHELFPKLWAERGAQEMKLQGLSKRATEKLIRQLLPEKATQEVIAAIQEKSAGNAFFLEELIRAVHQGMDQLPETVLAMTSSRIEALSAEERRVLRAASVFGETFWYDGLVRLLGGEDIPFDLSASLQMLVQREFIHVVTDSFSAQEYRFRHGLLREAAYASLTETDRMLGHRLAAQWLVSNPSAEPAVLADHLERAGLSSEAIRYYRDAAKDALQAEDLSLVHSRYQRAIKCGASGEILAELDTMVAESYAWQGNFLAAKKVFLQAQQKSTPQSLLWWRATGGLALTAIFSSDLEMLPVVMEQFESQMPTDEAGDVYVISAARTVPPWLILGQKERANFLWENICKLANKTPPLEQDAYAWMIITRGSISFWRDANPWTAYADYQAAIQLFEEIGATRSASIAKYFPVPALRALGALQEAEDRLRENLETLPSTDSFTRCYCYISLCELLAIQGRTAEALQAEPLLLQNVGNNFFMMQASKLSMAQVYFAAQDFPAARQRLDAIWSTPFPILEAVAHGLQAKMYLVEQKPLKALPHAQKSFEYVMTHGTGGSFAPRASCLWYAFTLDALGRQPEAREIIASTYHELCTIAARIPDEHYRKSFLEGAYENAGVIQLARQWGIAPE